MSKLTYDSNGTPQPAITQGNTQVVAIGAGAIQSATFRSSTTLIRVVATQNCWNKIGLGTQTPAADAAGSFYLPANVVEYWAVTAGQQLGVIEDSAAGFLSLTEAA